MTLRPRNSTLFPYTTLFRSVDQHLPNATVGNIVVDLSAHAEQLDGEPFFHRFCLRLQPLARDGGGGDRKSTRLNSSHLVISYAVFCLKKKNNNTDHQARLE